MVFHRRAKEIVRLHVLPVEQVGKRRIAKVSQTVSVYPETTSDLGLEMSGKRQAKALMAPVRKQTQVLLADTREKFLKAGFQVDTKLLEGNPRTQILEVAQRLKTQLVCVGAKGLSGINRFTLGSVSEWVSTYSPMAVLVMR